MINSIPEQIMAASRAVTLKHPNSMDCQVYRRVVKGRPGPAHPASGMATHGGLGMLTPEDDEAIEYRPLGAGKILITSRYEGTLSIVDRGDGVAPDTTLQEALIEPLGLAGASGRPDASPGFTPERYDLVGVMPGGGVLIGFEIMDVTGSVAIYPYTRRYIIAPRDQLHDLTPWQP
ncbi:hypothetical protein [Paraburkholderia sp. J10-1]|uniref:hypothetical protein n=1 Tax=Paraburkholderia sp. J10-1 TaxID=2805430 RepID=UPI002AB67C36|nr:hypothetical protein [Paraburkholderia sp. J10-1]